MSIRLLRIGDESPRRPQRSALRTLLSGGVGGTEPPEPVTSPEHGTGSGEVDPPASCPVCSTNRASDPDVPR